MNYPFIKPRYYWRLSINLFQFIKRPCYTSREENVVKSKVYDTIGLLIIKVIFSLTVSGLISLFYEPKNLATTGMAERFTPLVFLIVGGVILPILEETCFRLSLKFKPVYFAFSMGAVCYYMLTKVIYQTKISMVDDSFFYRVIGAASVVFLLLPIVHSTCFKQILGLFWERHFNVIYYLSCLSFAWLHIFNFELNLTNLLLLPVITLPQLFSGAIAGYTRMAFGFRYPLIVHMVTNTLFISLSFLPFD